MAPPYSAGILARSLVRVTGSGRGNPQDSVLCDLSRVSSLAASVPMPRNLPPALLRPPGELPVDTLRNPRLGTSTQHEQQTTVHPAEVASGQRKRPRSQAFPDDETYSGSKISKPDVVFSKSQMNQLSSVPVIQAGLQNLQQTRPTPQVVEQNHLQINPAPRVIVAQNPLQQTTSAPQVLLVQQNQSQQTTPAYQVFMVQLPSVSQNQVQQARPTPQAAMTQLQNLLPQTSTVPKVVVAQLQNLLPQTITLPQVAVAQQQPLQQSNFAPQINPEALQAIQEQLQAFSPSLGRCISLSEVVQESKQLREENDTMRKQLSLFRQLFQNKERLASVAKRLGVAVA